MPKAACLFHSIYVIYVFGLKEKFANYLTDEPVKRDVNGAIVIDFKKLILGALSFFANDATEWVRHYIEDTANNKVVFPTLNTIRTSSTKFWR